MRRKQSASIKTTSWRSPPSIDTDPDTDTENVVADTAWLHNNDQYSDVIVVLTTESPEECKTRLKGHCDTERTSGGTACSFEELPGHRSILATRSEYFQKCFSWNIGDTQHATKGKRQREPDSQPLAIVTVKTPEWIPAARSMVRFLYTQQLPEDAGRMELLQLYQLGDEYRISTLRCACLRRLAAVGLPAWPAPESQLLQGALATVLLDEASECAALANAAAAVCRCIVQMFHKLEEAWRSQDCREFFCTLPHALAQRIVRSRWLVVESENTVLVAVLSWLRTGGQAATEEQRRELVEAVRMAQLAPWFQCLAAFSVEEVQQLLPKAALFKLVQYSCSSEDAQGLMEEEDELLERWAEEREGAADFRMHMEVDASFKELADMFTRCKATGEEQQLTGIPEYFNGCFWTAGLTVVSGTEGVSVRADLAASLQVEGGRVQPEPGVGMPGYHVHIDWGREADIYCHDLTTTVAMELGQRFGTCLAEDLKEADELRSALSGCWDEEDVLTVQWDVSSS